MDNREHNIERLIAATLEAVCQLEASLDWFCGPISFISPRERSLRRKVIDEAHEAMAQAELMETRR